MNRAAPMLLLAQDNAETAIEGAHALELCRFQYQKFQGQACHANYSPMIFTSTRLGRWPSNSP